MASIFPSLSFSLFEDIHSLISWQHFCRFCTTTMAATWSGWKESYKAVLSAYSWGAIFFQWSPPAVHCIEKTKCWQFRLLVRQRHKTGFEKAVFFNVGVFVCLSFTPRFFRCLKKGAFKISSLSLITFVLLIRVADLNWRKTIGGVDCCLCLWNKWWCGTLCHWGHKKNRIFRRLERSACKNRKPEEMSAWTQEGEQEISLWWPKAKQ